MGFPTPTSPPYQGLPNPPNEIMCLRLICAQNAQIIALLSAGGGGGGSPAGKQRTLTSSIATTDGSVAAGSVGMQLTLSTDFAGTINGETWAGATTAAWSPPLLSVPGDTYPAVPYTISAGSLTIDVLT